MVAGKLGRITNASRTGEVQTQTTMLLLAIVCRRVRRRLTGPVAKPSDISSRRRSPTVILGDGMTRKLVDQRPVPRGQPAR